VKANLIARHKTAIGRNTLSRPLRLALEAQLLQPQATVFDYGCGRGDDVQYLSSMGIAANGWDPNHRPSARRDPADLVNLGYVVNVIEDPRERADALRGAWSLCRRVLVVAARLEHDTDGDRFREFGDGYLTNLKTFQKLYKQLELRDWIDQTLGVRSLPAAPGVFFVFRDETLRQSVLDSRYRRTRAAPKPRISDVLFEQHRAIFEPLMAFVADRGRLPDGAELLAFGDVVTQLGSVRKAFAVVRRVTGPDRWDQLRKERHEELLMRFALDRFGGRQRFSDLPLHLQLDVREFFGTYAKACEAGDKLLFRAGNKEELADAMRASPVGKLTGNALYVHVDALPLLPTILRVYEGCARSYLGHVEGANIIKLNREEPKVSYLFYPDFDTVAHPALRESLRLRLSNADVKHLDFGQSDNPPILHRKEDFLPPDDPRREKFARLTKAEEKAGLYADTARIGTQQAWNDLLLSHGCQMRGHRLCRATPNGTPVQSRPPTSTE
jgi:DNA phosphorothioation-associated putative methyltransferase